MLWAAWVHIIVGCTIIVAAALIGLSLVPFCGSPHSYYSTHSFSYTVLLFDIPLDKQCSCPAFSRRKLRLCSRGILYYWISWQQNCVHYCTLSQNEFYLAFFTKDLVERLILVGVETQCIARSATGCRHVLKTSVNLLFSATLQFILCNPAALFKELASIQSFSGRPVQSLPATRLQASCPQQKYPTAVTCVCESLRSDDLFTIMLDLYLTSLPNSFFNELTVVTFEQLNVSFLNLIRSTAFTWEFPRWDG